MLIAAAVSLLPGPLSAHIHITRSISIQDHLYQYQVKQDLILVSPSVIHYHMNHSSPLPWLICNQHEKTGSHHPPSVSLSVILSNHYDWNLLTSSCFLKKWMTEYYTNCSVLSCFTGRHLLDIFPCSFTQIYLVFFEGCIIFHGTNVLIEHFAYWWPSRLFPISCYTILQQDYIVSVNTWQDFTEASTWSKWMFKNLIQVALLQRLSQFTCSSYAQIRFPDTSCKGETSSCQPLNFASHVKGICSLS